MYRTRDLEVNTAMKQISYEQAAKRFLDQGRSDLELIEKEYVSWRQQALFFDKIYRDYFTAIPKNVYIQKSNHPKRGVENRKQTNIAKYGNACSLHSEEMKGKVRQINLDKYGFEHPWQSESIKEKSRQTIKEKYGVDNISQSETVKEKKKQTTQKNYGVSYPAQNKAVVEKQKETMQENYGVEHPAQSLLLQEKRKATLQEKYGVASPFQLPGVMEKSKKSAQENARKILETGETVAEWLTHITDTNKPSYQYISSRLLGQSIVSVVVLHQLLANYASRKTSLECLGEQLLETKHYNKTVPETRYKPDYKLSDAVFVNVDGLYWHSENNKKSSYHSDMRLAFEKKGFSILQFREDEITQKPSIVRSIVRNKIGATAKKVFARKCYIGQVPQSLAGKFLQENHLMGSIKAKHVGLFEKQTGRLVSILSYKTFKTGNCNIERFCSEVDLVVVGGFSKLMNSVKTDANISQVSYWTDLRYGTGNHLVNLGFRHVKDTLGWKWTDGTSSYNRLRCRANMDERCLPERAHAEELGWYRIYDAGQRLYVLSL